MLGPVGMLLSVPLTMTVKIAMEANPSTNWIAHLLDPADARPADENEESGRRRSNRVGFVSYERDSVRRHGGLRLRRATERPGRRQAEYQREPLSAVSPGGGCDSIPSTPTPCAATRRQPADGFRRQVARRFGLSPDQVVATNGGDEALRLGRSRPSWIPERPSGRPSRAIRCAPCSPTCRTARLFARS